MLFGHRDVSGANFYIFLIFDDLGNISTTKDLFLFDTILIILMTFLCRFVVGFLATLFSKIFSFGVHPGSNFGSLFGVPGNLGNRVKTLKRV